MPLIPLAALLIAMIWPKNNKDEQIINTKYVKIWNTAVLLIFFIIIIAAIYLYKNSIFALIFIALLFLANIFPAKFKKIKIIQFCNKKLIVRTCLLICAAICFYGFSLMPLINQKDNIRPHAKNINKLIPVGEELQIYKLYPKYQPFIFYLTCPYKFINKDANWPKEKSWFLFSLSQKKEKELQKVKNLIKKHNMQTIKIFSDKDGRKYKIVRKNY